MGLYENKEYEFRVCAVNANGEGEYLDGENPIIAKLPFGELYPTEYLSNNDLIIGVYIKLKPLQGANFTSFKKPLSCMFLTLMS